MSHRFLRQSRFDFERRAVEAHRSLPDPFLDNLIETHKRAAADEEDLLRIHLDVFLVRMFAAALRWNIAGATFQNLQERLLHAFAGNVPGDADVVSLAADLVDLVDINDADLRALDVVIRILNIFRSTRRRSSSFAAAPSSGSIKLFKNGSAKK